ncbi:hypothetical protein BD410DRAFT_780657 [Rickenella mellea]|uniref:F-box domain-containing protein n=1 Tax=Rickenella mellea TaxID=50990 RepID=A0A4R5XIF8_9AGAM|nr:hypothetical protein BD410DRAFT_780657 [Rickenella mellea]
MEQDEALNENDVSDWADLTRAFLKMKHICSKPLDASNFASLPIPNLDELTWTNTYPALRAQKAIRARLLQEMQMVEAKISFLQRSCNTLALRRGLRHLPDEILAQIFETGYTTDLQGNRFAITISHVNRRFRNVSLRLPRLWSTITNYQRVSELKVFLTRSKDMGIIIKLLPDGHPLMPAKKFIGIVVRHSQRWIEFDHGFDEEVEMDATLSRYKLDLPKLRKLTNNSGYLAPTLPKWNMPSLAEYEGDASPGLSATNMVSCTLDLWDNNGLYDLLSFISDNPTLRSLSLVFHGFIPYMGGSQVDAKATLSSLDTFSVHFDGGCYIDDDFERFVTNLSLPNLTQFSLKLSVDPVGSSREDCDTGRFFQVLLRNPNPYPKLAKLDVIIDAFFDIPSIELEQSLERLPSLRRIYVEAPGMDSSYDRWRCTHPLHSVELSKCDRFTRGFVESLGTELLRNDHSAEDRMQMFTVTNCRGLGRSSFPDLEAKLGDRFVFLP